MVSDTAHQASSSQQGTVPGYAAAAAASMPPWQDVRGVHGVSVLALGGASGWGRGEQGAASPVRIQASGWPSAFAASATAADAADPGQADADAAAGVNGPRSSVGAAAPAELGAAWLVRGRSAESGMAHGACMESFEGNHVSGACSMAGPGSTLCSAWGGPSNASTANASHADAALTPAPAAAALQSTPTHTH